MTGLLPIFFGRVLTIAPLAVLLTAVSLALLTGEASARPPECDYGEVC